MKFKLRSFPVSKQQRSNRLCVVFVLLISWSILVIGRIIFLQLGYTPNLEEIATSQHEAFYRVPSIRGKIVDRNGQVLAMSIPTTSVFVHPRRIQDAGKVEEFTAKLANIVNLSSDEIRKVLTVDTNYRYLRRFLDNDIADKIKAGEFKNLVGTTIEFKRVYPRLEAGALMIGRVGSDNKGLSGIEHDYDDLLTIPSYNLKRRKDAFGNIIDSNEFTLPQGGDVQLTVDAEIIDILQDEIERALVVTEAKLVGAVLIDASTGEVLGMAQTPSVDLGEVKDPDLLRNFAFESVFEPGSIVKPLVFAKALEMGVISLSETLNCEAGRYRVGRKVIRDVHGVGLVPMPQVVVRSSNIGMTKIAERMGSEALYNAIADFGFNDKSGLKISGESRGILRPLKQWARVDLATHSFGHGFAATMMQLVRAMGVLVNDGVMMPLKLVKSDEIATGKRVLTKEVANSVEEIMYQVVEDSHGTGNLASLLPINELRARARARASFIAGEGPAPRYDYVRVGGKTGTAQKTVPGKRGYSPNKHVSSFAGFMDLNQIGLPNKLALIVSVDEPNHANRYGGRAAGPVFSRVMKRVLKLYIARRALSNNS